MKYIGIWPEERKWNRRSSYIVLLPFLSMLCFVCVPQSINLPRIAYDLNLVVENLSVVNVTVTISLMKTVVFWMNGKCKNLMISPHKLYPILSERRIYQTSLTEIIGNSNFIYFPFSSEFNVIENTCLVYDFKIVPNKLNIFLHIAGKIS